MTKALGVGRSSRKNPSAVAKQTKRPREASGWKDAKMPTECPSSSNENINVNLVQVGVLLIRFVK